MYEIECPHCKKKIDVVLPTQKKVAKAKTKPAQKTKKTKLNFGHILFAAVVLYVIYHIVVVR